MRALDYSFVIDTCIGALRAFMRDIHCDNVVIGLSGGIDSSVVAALAVDALGEENVLGVLLPGPFSSEGSIKDAEDLAANLRIATKMISIENAVDACTSSLESANVVVQGLVSENLQARCRMVLLMAISNATGSIMLNTGNLSESCTGYSTLYGDTAGAFAPIGGLYKTEVFKLAAYMNEQAEKKGLIAPIPQHVMDKPPSAELSSDQTDEGSLGVSYEDLDTILYALLEDPHGLDALPREVAPATVDKVKALYRASAFKREIEPPFPSFAQRS